MLLKSMVLKNFRQFRGRQEISFSCDKDKNLTIILGGNTSGKTTIVQAFTWVLYGFSNFNTPEVLNKEIENEINKGDLVEAMVELCLVHDNVEYIITRKQFYELKNKLAKVKDTKFKVSYKQSDGQVETIRASAINSTINKILPQDLSSYFFFDGEKISNINTKKDVAEAVKGLMGLTVLSNALDHLKPSRSKSVIGVLNNSLDVKGNKKAEEAKNKINEIMKRHEEYSDRLDNIKDEILYYKSKKESIEQKLQDNQLVADLQKQKQQLERDVSKEQEALEEAEKRLVSQFNRDSVGFFAQPLIKQVKEILKKSKVDDKGIPNMNQRSIDYIIEKRGKCICGTIIDKVNENEAYKNLIQERDFLPPKAIGTIIKNFIEQMNIYESAGNNCHDNIKATYNEIIRCRDRVQEWNDQVEDISGQIINKEDIGKYEEELKDVKKRLGNFESERDSLNKNLGKFDLEIENYEKIYDSHAAASEKNKKIRECLKYSQAIYDWLRDTYDEKERELREQVEDRVNDIFSKMYHGRRIVVIDNQYRIKLLTEYDNKEVHTDESTGLAKVKNFAFVAGLVDLAREKVAMNKDNDEDLNLSSEPYPLVMDAPFTAVDKKHISNISEILPKIAEQVIMVILEEHWNFAKDTMEDRVGKKYYLEKQSETLTYIKEVI